MTKVKNFSRFYGLLKRMPGDKDGMKEQLVSQYTGGRTTSLKEIETHEYDAMCNGMEGTVGSKADNTDKFTIQIKSLRSSVLHRIQKLGIDTSDWSRVDAYCLNPRIAGKVFRKLTIPELEALIPKLESISRKDKKKTPTRKAPTKKAKANPVILTPEVLLLTRITGLMLN